MGLAATLNPSASSQGGSDDLVLHLTDQTFADSISSGYTLVDFWAEWCGPCRMIAPTIEALAVELKDKVKVAKLNIDENPLITSKYNIMSIPFCVLFKDGEMVGNILGAQPKQNFDKMIANALAE